MAGHCRQHCRAHLNLVSLYNLTVANMSIIIERLIVAKLGQWVHPTVTPSKVPFFKMACPISLTSHALLYRQGNS